MYLEVLPDNVCSAKGMIRWDIIMNNLIWLRKVHYALFKNGGKNSSCNRISFSFWFSIRNLSGGGRDNSYKLVHKTELVNQHKQMIKFHHVVLFRFLVHLNNSACLPHWSQTMLCFWSMLLGISPGGYLPDHLSTTNHSHQCTCCSSWLTEQMSSYTSTFHCNQKKCQNLI